MERHRITLLASKGSIPRRTCRSFFDCGDTTINASPPPPPVLGYTFYLYQNQDRTGPISTLQQGTTTFPAYFPPNACHEFAGSYIMVACYGTTGQSGAQWQTRVYSDASCQNLVFDNMNPTFCGPDVPNRSQGCDVVTGTVFATGEQEV